MDLKKQYEDFKLESRLVYFLEHLAYTPSDPDEWICDMWIEENDGTFSFSYLVIRSTGDGMEIADCDHTCTKEAIDNMFETNILTFEEGISLNVK